MSVSSEVRRTLVKSPPELWAELSDSDALMRHLGELGEIRITSIEPETKVEWEADEAIGVVELKPSGWGTKVTLSVTRNPPVPEKRPEPAPVTTTEPDSSVEVDAKAYPQPATTAEPEPTATATADLKPTVDPESESAVESECTPARAAEDLVEPKPEPAPELAAKAPEREPQLGFFARLFRKRQAKPVATAEPEPVLPVEPEVAPDPPEPELEVVTLAVPEPIYPERPPQPVIDLAAELASVEAQMAEETTALLTGVLDRLGAAHHRPFSRA
jgi:hypothetical protein